MTAPKKTKRNGIPEIDLEVTFRITHQAGMLSQLLGILGEHEALIGDIETVFIGRKKATRSITISFYDYDHMNEVKSVIAKFPHAEWIEEKDVVFDRHKGGKIYCKSTVELETLHDLRYIYTPGVARVCNSIKENPENAYKYTSIANSVGIFTNGTRVLGLGDIGPLASLPVMEGKAVIYDKFVGLSAQPILINTKDPVEFVNIVEKMALSFGGIHLEDISAPDCFYIEDELNKRLKQPVMHDDQHGTATVVLAAVMSACRHLKISNIKNLKIGQIGLGASGSAIGTLLSYWGADVYGVDRNPTSIKRFKDLGGKTEELDWAMKNCKIIISSTGVQGLLKPEMISKDQVILAISNPIPEISPPEALKAGAIIASDGQNINNALAYPGLFKGVLIGGGTSITPEMKVKAAEIISLASYKKELVPSPFNNEVHSKIASTIAKMT